VFFTSTRFFLYQNQKNFRLMYHKSITNMFKPFFIFCIIIFVSYGCGDQKITKNYPNGNIMEEYTVNKEQKKNGEYKLYFENGKVKETATYQNDQLIGVRTMYYENGNIETEENYTEPNVLNGEYKTYYDNGQLKLVKIYKNNAIQGTLKVFYPTGKIKEEVTMVDNNENGPFVEYFENGQVQWKGTYLNGDNEFGLLEEWDSLGNPIKKMKCDSLAICRTFWRPGMPVVDYNTVK